jgi:UbiD family decarboxylase
MSLWGFAKWVGMRVLSTPHCLGHATIVIVVDEDVDPFDLNQVMWAISVKVNPAYDTRCHPPDDGAIDFTFSVRRALCMGWPDLGLPTSCA